VAFYQWKWNFIGDAGIVSGVGQYPEILIGMPAW